MDVEENPGSTCDEPRPPDGPAAIQGGEFATRCLVSRLIGGPALTAVLLFATRSPVPVSAQSGSQTLVIGADHADPAKHPPDSGRLFEYTDFFSLDASLRKGDTIDLRFTPGFSR